MDEEWFDREKVEYIKTGIEELLEEFDGKVEKQIALQEVNLRDGF